MKKKKSLFKCLPQESDLKKIKDLRFRRQKTPWPKAGALHESQKLTQVANLVITKDNWVVSSCPLALLFTTVDL